MLRRHRCILSILAKSLGLWSMRVITGVLSQYGDDGVEHPIVFYSWKLNPTQQGWSTVEKEAYAALNALRKVR